MSARRVLFVTPEAYPLVKTGGLADYAGGLSKALVRRGLDVCLLLPAYAGAVARLAGAVERIALDDDFGLGEVALISGRVPVSGVPVWLIDCPALYARPGGIYQNEEGEDWPDNALRFGLLSRVGAWLALGRGPVSWRPDVVHLNEWQSGPAAALLAHAGPDAPPTLFTIHNMAFQGLFDASVLDFLRLPACVFDVGGVEFFGKVSFLKAGIRYANRIATVSRTYAKEIMTPEFGFGLDGLLRQRADDVVGILNGADYEEWNPQSDPHIAARFDPDNLIGKGKCKAALQAQLGLQANAGVPILAYMSRLTHQKLTDVLVDALPMILARGVQVVVLGRGDRVLEAALLMLARRFAGELAVRADYDEVLARQILAGADMLLAPARFEPCGLTQMYALRYGTVPIVSLIGGLTETVVDARADTLSDGSATGFVFHERSLLGLLGGVDRALALYRASAVWHMLQRNGMQVDFSWDRSTREYEAVYEALVATQSVRGAASPPRPGEERSPPQPVREVVL